MTKGLETGYVPGERIITAISTALNITTPWEQHENALQPLTSHWEVWDVWKMLGSGRPHWVQFDFADKVLCLLHLTLLWRGELEDIYTTVSLPEEETRHRRVPRGHKRCEAKGCTEIFKVACTPQGGGRARKFCSVKCRVSANNRKQRDKTRVGRYGSRYGTCANGHDRSPENAYISPAGKTMCRPCLRAAAKRQRQRRKAAA